MTEASGLSSAGVSVELDLLAEAVSQELAAMLQAGNYDAVKLLLEPVQPVDIAEAIGSLPANLQAIASPAQQGRSHQCLRVPRHRHPAKPAEPAALWRCGR